MIPMYPGQPNSPQTELAQAIDDTQTTITLLNGAVLPDAPNLAVLGVGELAETILYGAKEGNVLSEVTRGFQGTAQSWQEGTKLARNFTAYDYDAMRTNVEGIQDELENLDLSAENVTLDSSDYQATNVKAGLEEAKAYTEAKIDEHNDDSTAHRGFVGRPQFLPSFSDFNDLSNVGVYHGVINSAKTNEPISGGNSSRRITVYVEVTGNRLTQTLRYDDGFGAGNVFWRNYDSGAWGIWRNIGFQRTDSTQKLRAEVKSSAPSSPANGDIWYDSSEHKFKGRANGAWV